LLGAGLLAVVLCFSGCEKECVSCLDDTPPAVPTNVFSVTGDGRITIFWSYLEYPHHQDLEKYLVWRDDDGDGGFDFRGEVPVDQPFDEFTYCFVDEEVVNGFDYEYAVSAMDAAGNESELSYETVIDTPRPAGYSLELHDYLTSVDSSLCGFDFSQLQFGRLDPTPPTLADILVAFEGGIPFVYSARPGNVRLQDYGTIALEWVDWAPADGYSSAGRAELILGHSYVVEIAESLLELNYAKFEVVAIGPSSVLLDWAYQPVVGLPELRTLDDTKPPAGDPELIRF